SHRIPLRISYCKPRPVGHAVHRGGGCATGNQPRPVDRDAGRGRPLCWQDHLQGLDRGGAGARQEAQQAQRLRHARRGRCDEGRRGVRREPQGGLMQAARRRPCCGQGQYRGGGPALERRHAGAEILRAGQGRPVAAKLREAGAIIIGKTNMHELAFGISGYNGAFKTSAEFGVRNAYDPAKIAGGSSSGKGAAIGARIVTAGLGTDTRGSGRLPRAVSGCAPLPPPVGRYPQGGIAPISHSRDTAGPMAATMADVALLDRVLAGGDPILPANLKEVRIGVVKAMLANLDGDTEAAFRAALDQLKAEGVTVVDVEIDKLAELNGQVGFPVALYEAYDDIVAYLKHTGTGITVEALAKEIASPDVKGTYDGLVIPRKLPGPDNTVVDAMPVYDAAIKT